MSEDKKESDQKKETSEAAKNRGEHVYDQDDLTETDFEKTQWYKPGKTKSGEPMPPRTKAKEQLSSTEVKVLELFFTNEINTREKAQTTQQMLAFYRERWPNDNFNDQKMSRDLKSLRQNGFLDNVKGRPVKN